MRADTATSVLILLAATPCLRVAPVHAGECSTPVVIVMLDIGEDALFQLQADYEFKPEEAWNSDLGRFVIDLVRPLSRGVELISIDEIYSAVQYDKDLLENNEELRHRLGRRDYLLRVGIYGVGGAYQMYVTLTSIDTAQIVMHEGRKGNLVHQELELLLSQFGNLHALIQAHELEYPGPARDATLEVAVEPAELVPGDGITQAKIKVKVIHCNGRVGHSKIRKSVVFFDKEGTRGRVRGDTSGRYIWGPVDVDLTNTFSYVWKDGFARATYLLDPKKGTGPGTDVIGIRHYGRGKKKTSTEARIRIISLGDGRIEVELTPSYRAGGAGADTTCAPLEQVAAVLPFRVEPSTNACRFDVVAVEAKPASYRWQCRMKAKFADCTTIESGSWENSILQSVIDFERDADRPLTLKLQQRWKQRLRESVCVHAAGPTTSIREEPASRWSPIHENSWPLADGYQEDFGIFRYRLRIDEEKAKRLRETCVTGG